MTETRLVEIWRPFTREVSPRAAYIVCGLFVAVVTALGVWAARSRGIWLDEIWTLWMSRPDLDLAASARERWIQDTNPPFFYFASWLANPVTGMDLFARRLLNLVPLAFYAGASAYIGWKYERAWRFAAVLILLVLGGVAFIPVFAEHRSYGAQLCFAAVLALVLYAIIMADDDFSLRRDTGLGIIAAIAILFAFNLNQVTAVICGCVLTSFIVMFGRVRLWRWTFLLAGVAVVSGLALIACTVAQSGYLYRVVGQFWISASLAQAANALWTALRHAMMANLAAALIAAFSLWRSDCVNNRAWIFMALLIAGLVAASAGLLALHVLKPLLIARYLISVYAFGAAWVAALTSGRVFSRRWLFGVVVLNALVVVTHEARVTARQKNWDEAADFIAAQQRACPGALVYAVAPPLIGGGQAPPAGPPQAIVVHDWGYARVAAAHGLRLTIYHPSEVARLPLSAYCPTLLWSEHYQGPHDVGRIAALAKFGDGTAPIQPHWTDRGFVLVLRPASVAGPSQKARPSTSAARRGIATADPRQREN